MCKNAREAFELYALRTQIEERHRQIKTFWHINKFTSPYESLIEAHVLFTLLTYSLIQLYLNKNLWSKITVGFSEGHDIKGIEVFFFLMIKYAHCQVNPFLMNFHIKCLKVLREELSFSFPYVKQETWEKHEKDIKTFANIIELFKLEK